MLEQLRPREGWLSLLLVFFLLFSVTLSLTAAQWAPGLEILLRVFIGAFVVGLFLAKNEVRGIVAHPFALVAGFLWVWNSAMSLITARLWEDKAADVAIRMIHWGQAVVNRDTATDTLPFVILMAGLIWLITYNAVWSFFRKKDLWGTVLPAATAILINTYYGDEEIGLILVFFLVIAFLLIIRMNLFEQEVRWQHNEIAYSKEIHYDFFREGAIFAVAIVAFAWLLPGALSSSEINPLLTRLGTPWGQAQQEWSRLFSTLNYQPRAANGTWFGTTMSFRGPLNRTDRLVMTVKAPQGRYWRAVVLDEYTSAGWTISSRTMSNALNENQEFVGKTTTPPGRELVGQQFTIYAPAGTLMFAASQPVKVSVPSKVLYVGPDGSTDTPASDAISQLYGQQALFEGQTYSAVSAIPKIDMQSLRGAGTTYPAVVVDHYTALPGTVTQRTVDLARTVTRGTDNAYDAAVAIESYLRSFPYNETILGPNPGEDGVDYFLFREKQGYCDYYASSMAVMLRSLGIPARIAQGYNQGQRLENGDYEVRQTNAHTWVEVYFPTYGWIEFEPTASEPAISRPASPQDNTLVTQDQSQTDTNLDDMLAEQREARENRDPSLEDNGELPTSGLPQAGGFTLDPRIFMIPLGLIAAVGLAGLTGRVAVQRRWRGLGVIEKLYDQIVLIGRAIGQKLDPSLTPREYADKVGQQVPPARAPLTRIADLFSKQRFSQERLGEEEEKEAASLWAESRQTLFRAIMNRFKPKPREPKVPPRRGI